MRRLALATALCLALPAAAMAQDANNTPPPAGGWQGMKHYGPAMWGKGHHHMDQGEMLDKFYAANTSHDGHLTLAQAKSAGLKPVVDHFSEIDTNHRGYVTFYDIQAWHMDDMAKRLEMKANELRLKD
jgi:opacity protein-like surface antigen